MRENLFKKIASAFLTVNIIIVYNIFFQLNKILNYIAARFLNIFVFFEVISRIVVFFYFLRNLILFYYLTEKNQIIIIRDNLLYSNRNFFIRFFVRPFNYFFVCTLSSFQISYSSDLLIYFHYKIDFNERIMHCISDFVNFENNLLSSIFSSNYLLKKENFFTSYAFLTYNYSPYLNKISYIYTNNTNNLIVFLYDFNYYILNKYDFMETKVKEISEFLNIQISHNVRSFVFSIQLGCFTTLKYAVVFFYNLVIRNIPLISIANNDKSYFQRPVIYMQYIMKIFFPLFAKYIVFFIIGIVDFILNIINDIKFILATIIGDFTFFDCFKYFVFVVRNQSLRKNFFEMAVISGFLNEMIENIKIAFLIFYFYIINKIIYFFYEYVQFYFVICIIQFLFFVLKQNVRNIFYFPVSYLNFFIKIYFSFIYFVEVFFYFITSSFYSEHIFILLLIEFFIEFFSLNISSIEFVISLIFIIISSLISSQILDFFENYNIDILMESFSLFFFCFIFIYEQQKQLISLLNLKIKSYKNLKITNNYGVKIYKINRRILKLNIILQKIKKYKLK